MKLLYIVDNYYPHIGGAELLFQQLAEGMAAQNHTVTVLAPKNFPDYLDNESHNGVRIVRQRVPPFAQRYFFTFWAIVKAITLARKHDLIHTATYNSIVPSWIAGKVTGTKTVLTVYEVWDQKWYSLSGQSRLKATILRLIERILLSFHFDQVICISDSTLRDYQQLFPTSRAKRIYPGVDYASMDNVTLTKEQKAAFRRSKGWSAEDYVVLGFGRPGISKGFDYLVDAVPGVLDTLPRASFRFIWPSAPNFISLRDSLVQRLHSFNRPDAIEVLDKQTRADLFAYLQSVDCVVIPSLAEGFGYAAIEACRLAKSVVATKAGSIPEVVSGNVYLVTPANSSALAQGIIDSRNQTTSQQAAHLFTNEATLALHVQVYETLLGKRRESDTAIG
ncbi:glycosyltransferase family 4 protein [Spirosoma agri]|uniref:Glycosyltransferase family 4 protein n=1 Tax=Spirosoma agri TaxID=1987381 RepID=A0A6M0IBR0_9BACT|nr:glycosyltransferase family 4 protein [Spirosoma agri]NEU65594.1 glycosyltransferase family 4 protein [Spirosoma agri]